MVFRGIYLLALVGAVTAATEVMDKANTYYHQMDNSISKYPLTGGFQPRDSYADASSVSGSNVVAAPSGGYAAAAGSSYGVPDQEYGQTQKFHYQIMQNPSQNYGVAQNNGGGGWGQDEEDDDDFFGLGSGLGGLGGLGGGAGGAGGGAGGSLAVLKVLKKLKILKWIKIFKVLSPIFRPIFLPLLIPFLLPLIILFAPILLLPFLIFLPLLIIPLLFVPIPVITIPSNGRMWGFGGENRMSDSGRLLKDVLTSDECVERISCEISRIARKYQPTQKILSSALDHVPSQGEVLKRVSRAVKNNSESCGSYSCHPIRFLRKTFKF